MMGYSKAILCVVYKINSVLFYFITLLYISIIYIIYIGNIDYNIVYRIE